MTKRKGLDYTFEVWQGGIKVASVTSANLDQAQREIMHYAAVYSQDGECTIKGLNVAHTQDSDKR